MRALLILSLFALAACGADGEPSPPIKPGISITGTAEIGVVGS